MKKLGLILIGLLILVGCMKEEVSPHTINIEENLETYTYTVDGEDKEYVFRIPQLSTTDEQLAAVSGPIYSLNPLVENSDGRNLSMSTFYKNDDVDTYTKDRIYNLARYGFGFWDLNNSGENKVKSGTLLNKNDYQVLFGDFYHDNDFNNLDYIKYYLATQQLIWETIQNPETGFNFQIEFTDIDLSFEISQILDTQSEYSKTPFFGGSVINVTQARLESLDPFTLTDNNGVLHRYDIVLSDDLSLIETEEENVLSFVVNSVSRNTRIDFVPHFLIKQELSQVFSSNDNISYLSIGQDRALSLISSLHIEQETSSNTINLAITTYDVDTKMEIYGAQYQVSTGPEFLEPLETTVSSNGMPALLEGLASGTYYVQQILAPEGYALNQEVETISISGGILEMTYPIYNTKK